MNSFARISQSEDNAFSPLLDPTPPTPALFCNGEHSVSRPAVDPNEYISTVKHVACVYAEVYRETPINPFHMDTCFAVYITVAAKPDVNVIPYVFFFFFFFFFIQKFSHTYNHIGFKLFAVLPGLPGCSVGSGSILCNYDYIEVIDLTSKRTVIQLKN